MNLAAQALPMSIDLQQYGISSVSEVIHNPTYEMLFQEETADGLQGLEKGIITDSGAVAVDTGKFTGRVPKDKFIVEDDTTRDTLWWSRQGENDNKPISTDVWADLKKLTTEQLSGKRLFVVDAFCGANENN